jgi:predicted nicotinamide N-methyase
MTLALIPLPDIDRLRGRLLHRIHQRYQTITQPVHFGSITLEFTRIANPDHVLDQVVAEEDRREKITGQRHENPLHLPYWAELWESAAGLATVISKLELSPQTNVLDLGCGMGLAGTAAAARGANVLFADLESPALLFAQLNTLTFSPRPRTRQLNWDIDRLNEKFDLILGADILYDRKQWNALHEFWLPHLAPGGSILLAEPGRQTGDLFIHWIQEKNWTLIQSTQLIPPSNKSIRIFQLQKK